MATGRPMLLVRGADSDILETYVADRKSAMAPHMTRVDIPGVGHAPTLEEPQALAALDSYFAAAA